MRQWLHRRAATPISLPLNQCDSTAETAYGARRREAGGEQKSREGEGAGASSVEADVRDDAEDDLLAEEFAEIDAVLARSSKILNGADVPARAPRSDDRPELIYDLDWNEEERLAEWQDVIARTRDLPVVLRGAILFEAWSDIQVLQHAAWLGPLLVAALLRQEGV